MADGERRMLFDIRGRRKNVVKVVYGILAVMMGASLFLVVGPVNIGSLLSTSDEVNRSADIFDEQTERIEQRLRKDPENPDILISLTRTRLNAARAKSEADPTSGETRVTGTVASRVRKGDRRLGPLPEGRRRTEPLGRLPRLGLPLRPRPELENLRGSDRIHRRSRRRAADRRHGAPQRRHLDDPRRLRVPGRGQGRRRQGGSGSQGADPVEVGKEAGRKTADRLRETVEGNPESQEGSRKGRKGQRQGSAGKPARRPRRLEPDDDHPLAS